MTVTRDVVNAWSPWRRSYAVDNNCDVSVLHCNARRRSRCSISTAFDCFFQKTRNASAL